jgi:hypothetical protein
MVADDVVTANSLATHLGMTRQNVAQLMPAKTHEAIATASLNTLDQLARTIWQGHAAGVLNDDDAQRLAETICSIKGSASVPSSATKNGTLRDIKPEMKCASRDR